MVFDKEIYFIEVLESGFVAAVGQSHFGCGIDCWIWPGGVNLGCFLEIVSGNSLCSGRRALEKILSLHSYC